MQMGAVVTVDANSVPFPVKTDFDPMLLRAEMHADSTGYDPSVGGQAAWHCLDVLALDSRRLFYHQQGNLVCLLLASLPASTPYSWVALRDHPSLS